MLRSNVHDVQVVKFLKEKAGFLPVKPWIRDGKKTDKLGRESKA